MKDALEMAHAALERHPDWYGIKKDATPEEDADALKEVQEMKQFEEEVRNLPDGDVQGR